MKSEPHGIAALGEIGRRHTERYRGIHQTRAIHVGGQSMRVRRFGDRVQRLDTPARPTATVRSLLDLDQTLRRRIARHRANRLLECVCGELSALARQALDQRTRDRRRCTALAGEDVRRFVRKDLLPRPAMRRDRHLVAHGARWQEDRRFLAKQCGSSDRTAPKRWDPSPSARHPPQPPSSPPSSRASAWSACPTTD